MIHLTVIIKHIKCYIPRNVGQMLSFWNNTLFYPCRCGSFPLLTEQPETCLERPKQGHKYPNYILSKMLILSTFIQDSQSLCVQWAKNKRKGLPCLRPHGQPSRQEGVVGASSPEMVRSPQNHIPFPRPSKHSSWHRESIWKWEGSFPMLCLWVLLPYFVSQNSRYTANTVVLIAPKGRDIFKILWKNLEYVVAMIKNTSFKRWIPQIFIWHLLGATRCSRHWRQNGEQNRHVN